MRSKFSGKPWGRSQRVELVSKHHSERRLSLGRTLSPQFSIYFSSQQSYSQALQCWLTEMLTFSPQSHNTKIGEEIIGILELRISLFIWFKYNEAKYLLNGKTKDVQRSLYPSRPLTSWTFSCCFSSVCPGWPGWSSSFSTRHSILFTSYPETGVVLSKIIAYDDDAGDNGSLRLVVLFGVIFFRVGDILIIFFWGGVGR